MPSEKTEHRIYTQPGNFIRATEDDTDAEMAEMEGYCVEFNVPCSEPTY